MNGKRLLGAFVSIAFFAGLGYWLFLYYSDPANAPSINDIWQTAQSWGYRVYSTIFGSVEDTLGQENYLDKAIRIIANFEGFSPKVYNDAGHNAIGYGHDFVDGDGFTETSTISEADARALLRADVESRFDPAIDSHVTVPLNDDQRAALLSFVYNVGIGAFAGSTLLRYVNQGDFDNAANEFPKWDHSAGQVNSTLQARRASEQTLFLS